MRSMSKQARNHRNGIEVTSDNGVNIVKRSGPTNQGVAGGS
jgi:hypothetical protein